MPSSRSINSSNSLSNCCRRSCCPISSANLFLVFVARIVNVLDALLERLDLLWYFLIAMGKRRPFVEFAMCRGLKARRAARLSSGARNKQGKYRSKDRQPKANSTAPPMGAKRDRVGITGRLRSATRLPECILQRARDVLEDLFFPLSIIALRTDRTNLVVDGHVAAVELNDARFDDDIVTAINQNRSCIWLAHRALWRSPRLPLSLPSKRTRYGHGTSPPLLVSSHPTSFGALADNGFR
jgi:hypothetical protein